jgi:hypothetical protein
MTIREAAARHVVCLGSSTMMPLCPWAGTRRHMAGFIDVFGVAHFSDRRFTRRALRNLLLLVARRDRAADQEFLNLSQFEFFYLWYDNVTASRMAMDLGVRLPARLSRLDRLRCLQLARKSGARLSRRSSIYAWATDDV